ncbi:MAG: sugar phosphate isomerase/epimerase [Clostridia bacterium]|nr:sugar phosphate isomerase/epimerase [Clostridia bacterium]
MIRLSAFSDEAGKELSVQIAALLRNNIHLTELRAVGGKNVKDLTLAEAREISAELTKNGIALSALGSPMGKVDITVDFDAYLAEVRHMCSLAQVLGTDRIRMFSFYNAYESRDTVIAYLRRMVEVAKEYGVTLCHENEKKIYGDVVERVLDIKENVPGLSFVYDPANFLQCDEMPDKTLPALHGMSLYFHIKDVIHESGTLVPAGYGDGQIETLVRMIDRDTILTLEPHLKVFSGYSEIDGEEMKHRFRYESNEAAFDAAVAAMKKILLDCGYTEEDGGFVKK